MIGVTTFSPQGYEAYGREFLDSVEKYWPGEFIVYVDDTSLTGPFKIRNISSCFGHDQFIEYCKRNEVFQGKIMGGYHYTYDAVKFCHKVFAQLDVLKDAKEKVFWIDADSVFLKPISNEFLESLFEGKTLSLLQRPGFYTESGFVGFDPLGNKFKEFLDVYTNMYRKGIIFTLPGWHDCYALDEAVKISGVPVNNLSPFFEYRKTPLEVIEDSVLGPYLEHKKGNRKWKPSGTTNPTLGVM